MSPSIANYRLGLGKRLGYISGLTLPAAVARGRHQKLSPITPSVTLVRFLNFVVVLLYIYIITHIYKHTEK